MAPDLRRTLGCDRLMTGQGRPAFECSTWRLILSTTLHLLCYNQCNRKPTPPGKHEGGPLCVFVWARVRLAHSSTDTGHEQGAAR